MVLMTKSDRPVYLKKKAPLEKQHLRFEISAQMQRSKKGTCILGVIPEQLFLNSHE